MSQTSNEADSRPRKTQTHETRNPNQNTRKDLTDEQAIHYSDSGSSRFVNEYSGPNTSFNYHNAAYQYSKFHESSYQNNREKIDSDLRTDTNNSELSFGQSKNPATLKSNRNQNFNNLNPITVRKVTECARPMSLASTYHPPNELNDQMNEMDNAPNKIQRQIFQDNFDLMTQSIQPRSSRRRERIKYSIRNNSGDNYPEFDVSPSNIYGTVRPANYRRLFGREFQSRETRFKAPEVVSPSEHTKESPIYGKFLFKHFIEIAVRRSLYW